MHSQRFAFSLVELSIVLVILGLLTGGILAGQSLIHAAELRAVTVEYQRYYTASQSFRDKYFAVPGDFNNAQAFWGQSTACSGTSATGVCNGNGDNYVAAGTAASTPGEMFMFWRELALAGLLEGNYSGISGAAGGGDTVPGTNSPKSKLSNAGWGVWTLGNYAGDGGTYKADYGNVMLGVGAYQSNAWPLAPAFKPEDAWNIDTKMDDGKPGTGRVIAREDEGWGGTNPCTTSTSLSDYSGTYNLSNSALACGLHFTKLF